MILLFSDEQKFIIKTCKDYDYSRLKTADVESIRIIYNANIDKLF